MDRKKEKPVCGGCKSENVLFDAWSSWNSELGKYELENTFDNAFCSDCDGECSVNWIEIP